MRQMSWIGVRRGWSSVAGMRVLTGNDYWGDLVCSVVLGVILHASD